MRFVERYFFFIIAVAEENTNTTTNSNKGQKRQKHEEEDDMAAPRKVILNMREILNRGKGTAATATGSQQQQVLLTNTNNNSSTLTAVTSVDRSSSSSGDLVESRSNSKQQVLEQKSVKEDEKDVSARQAPLSVNFKEFPFEPYAIQQQFMDNLYQTLEVVVYHSIAIERSNNQRTDALSYRFFL